MSDFREMPPIVAVTVGRMEQMNPHGLVRLHSPIGRIEIRSSDERVTALSIESDGNLPSDGVPENSTPTLRSAAEQVDEYFAGDRHTFDLPVQLVGTAFRMKVWHQLQNIGWGESASYGLIASSVGAPSAVRAVGGAIGANPIPLIVGCHRVLSADGRVTGYSAGDGIATKRWLLVHESIGHRS